MLLEKAISSYLPYTHNSHQFQDELQAQREMMSTLMQEMAEKDKAISELHQQISKLQSEASDKKDSDILSLQLQLSELIEVMAKKENEKEEVSAQLITSSRVVQTLEEVPAELSSLTEKLLSQPVAELTPQCRAPGNVPSSISMTCFDNTSPILIDNGSDYIYAGITGDDAPHSVFPSIINLHSSSYGDHYIGGAAPIVIDNGSDSIYAGIAGDDAPRSVFPSIINSHSPGHGDHYIGGAAQNKRDILSLKYPVERGIVTNWDDMEKIWSHIFGNELRVDPGEHPTLMMQSTFSQPNQDKMMEIMFENFKVPSTYVINSSLVPIYSSGRATAVIVDIGHGVFRVMPIYEGYFMQHASYQLSIAGSDLTDYLATLLAQKNDIAVRKDYVRDLKEKLCYVAPLDVVPEPTKASLSYEIFHKTTAISITDRCRYMCPEALFQPSLLGMDCDGVDMMTYKSILRCGSDVHDDMCFNIVLSGGSTLFPGFADRLQKEITRLAQPYTLCAGVKVIAPPERKYSSWIGGSLMASLPDFQPIFISKREYEELGPYFIQLKLRKYWWS